MPDRPTIIVAVLHPEKLPFDPDDPIEMKVNVPLSPEGRKKAYDLIEPIRALGPFWSICSSPLMRAMQTASILGLGLDLEMRRLMVVPELAQMASYEEHPRTREMVSLRWPGHEDDDHQTWQRDGLLAIQIINTYTHCDGARVLAIGHRGPFGGVVAHCRGIHDVEGIRRVVREEQFAPKGYFLIEVAEDGTISFSLPPMG